MENPFIITGKIKPEYFCDRDVEAEKIIRKVTSGENIVLMAARHIEIYQWVFRLWPHLEHADL